MGDNQSSFFGRFLERGTDGSWAARSRENRDDSAAARLTSNLDLRLGTSTDSSRDTDLQQLRHKCDPSQKSFVSMFFDKLAKRYAERRADEARCTRQRSPSAPLGNDQTEDGATGAKKQPPAPPPESARDDALPGCFIKEQNPLAPLCCEVRSDEEEEEDEAPCPPAGYPQDPRVPSCGCDRCRESGYHGRCCDRRTFVQRSAEAPPRLDRA